MSLLTKKLAVVIGSAELGSACAVRLHEAGFATVLCDDIDPSGIRRGMSFIDAWYLGAASLAGVRATFCGSIRSIPTVLAAPRTLAATTWSWRGVAAQFGASVIIDARNPFARPRTGLIGTAPADALTIAVDAGCAPREDVHVLLRLPPGTEIAADPDARACRSDSRYADDEPYRNVVLGRTSGRFHTAHQIGDRVDAGEAVGGVGARSIVAPVSGVLSGLAARGSRIAAGDAVLEVDTRGDPVRCFLVPAGCDRFARDVVEHAAVHCGMRVPGEGSRWVQHVPHAA